MPPRRCCIRNILQLQPQQRRVDSSICPSKQVRSPRLQRIFLKSSMLSSATGSALCALSLRGFGSQRRQSVAYSISSSPLVDDSWSIHLIHSLQDLVTMLLRNEAPIFQVEARGIGFGAGALSGVRVMFTETDSPGGVNLMELVTRFRTTWTSLCLSMIKQPVPCKVFHPLIHIGPRLESL